VTRKLEIGRAASEEFEAAVRWYEERRRGLGAEFYDAVSSTLDLIADQPEIGTRMEVFGAPRRMLVARFPYQVVYHLSQDRMVIVAIAHLKRRPNYWKARH
jgi:plasmid stabilization system protein ParE